MDWLTALLSNHESVAYTVLIYSIVIFIGVALGRVKILGISLGITFVLFMGIFISHFGFTVNEHILHFIKEFGLILFVYTIGLQVGPGFFASFKKEGITLNFLAMTAVILGIITTVSIHFITGTGIHTMVGIMSGAVTNTPGLGAAQQTLMDVLHNESERSAGMQTLSTGYAIAYPFGVVGIIITMLFIRKLFKVDIQKESRLNSWKNNKSQSLTKITVEVANPAIAGKKLRVLWETLQSNFVVSRMYFQGKVIIPQKDEILNEGSVLLIIVPSEDADRMINLVGKKSTMDLSSNKQARNIVSRRINVTQSYAYTKTIGEIAVGGKFSVSISRVFRAGVEFIPNKHTKLQFGDTITAIGEEANVNQLAKAFGNSKKKLGTPHIAELFLGITLGVLLGSIPLNIPGIPVPVKLGLAGGPLIVAILISRYGGKISVTHYVSNSANLMVREIGIVLFLASVGLGAGGNFWNTLTNGDGLVWMLYGAMITVIPLLFTALISRIFFKLNYLEICGLLAGASTDPPALAFANQSAGSDAPAVTYATIYPLTTFLRIMAAQVILLLLA